MNRDDQYAVVLAEVLEAAREEGERAAAGEGELEQGQALAYQHIIELALENAEMVGLPAADIGLAGYDPDKLLKTG